MTQLVVDHLIYDGIPALIGKSEIRFPLWEQEVESPEMMIPCFGMNS
jgi:hypothetical protein